MKTNIIPLPENIQYLKSSQAINQLLQENKTLHSFYAISTGIICLSGDRQVVLYRNNQAQYYFFLDLQPDDAFIYFIEHFITKKNITIKIAYQLLEIASSLNFSEKKFFELFPHINWQLSRKGLDYYREFQNFSTILKNKLFTKKISLKEAYFFHNYFQSDYDKFLTSFPDNLSFSRTNEIIRNIVEYAKKSKKTIGEIYTEINQPPQISLYDHAFTLRYPLYSKYNSQLSDYITSLKLPGGVKIEYDKTFENSNYTMNITFKNLPMLLKKLDTVIKTLNNVHTSQTDLFDQNTLFDTQDFQKK